MNRPCEDLVYASISGPGPRSIHPIFYVVYSHTSCPALVFVFFFSPKLEWECLTFQLSSSNSLEASSDDAQDYSSPPPAGLDEPAPASSMMIAIPWTRHEEPPPSSLGWEAGQLTNRSTGHRCVGHVPYAALMQDHRNHTPSWPQRIHYELSTGTLHKEPIHPRSSCLRLCAHHPSILP